MSVAAHAATLTPAEQRGRQIYLRGESPSGRPITAIIGQGETTEIPATALACGSCHGPAGQGVAEGTIVPADIRWSALKTVLRPADGRGRRRLRYDDALLARAIRKGRDPSDEPLSPIMPRFRLDDRDLADLIAYLHRLGDEPQPGLTADTLTLATLIPLTGPRAATGALTRDVLAAALADVNAQGGVHGRTLKVRAIDSATPDATKRATEELTGDGIFALVCASLAPAVESLIHRERIPLITPLPPDTGSGATAPSSFFLFSDLESQALALAAHVGAGERNVYLLHGDTPAARAAVTALQERAESLQWTIRETLDGQKRDNDLLILLGIDPTETLRPLDALDWHPQLLIAGSALTKLPAFPSSIVLATPTLPADLTPEAHHDLAALAERHHLPPGNIATQTATYAAVKILLEALKRTGHDLTREKLITTLESLYQYPTGLTPPVTWSRNHHLGTTGAYLLTIDPATRNVVPAGWVAPLR